MKQLSCLALISLLLAGAALGLRAAPETISFNGAWAFAYTPQHGATVPPAAAFKGEMPVPGCWDDNYDQTRARATWPEAQFNLKYQPIKYPMSGKPADASLPFLLGTGWYRRSLNAPASWQGHPVTLAVGRVVMEAWVYVNGREVHHHLGHSTTWQAELGPYLKYGAENEIVIAVDNTRTDRIGTIIRGWAGKSSGIFGPVSLHVAGTAGIGDLYVYPEGERLHWRVETQGAVPAGAELRWRIVEPQGSKTVLSGQTPASGRRVDWTTEATGIKPWSDHNPQLYRVEAELVLRNDVLDTRGQPFGRRALTTEGMGLRLNGQPILLRGDCEHAYYPETTTPPLDIDWYRKHVRRLKEIGFNWLRFHTSVPLEPYLQAADELGMMIQVEAPIGFTLPEWRDILRFCRTHPAVVLYCGGNEDYIDDARVEFFGQCATELRQAAPDALFNPQSGLRGVEYGLLPEQAAHVVKTPFPHDEPRLSQLKTFSDVFGAFALGRLSYGSLQGEPVTLDRDLSIYERPCLTHEMGICGGYPNLIELVKRYRNSRIGGSLFAGAIEELRRAGLITRVQIYVRNASAWQRLMLKDTLETARATRLAGYDLLGANDTHWHRSGYDCGVMNEFDELKPGRTVTDVLGYNGESVLLISDKRERNLVAGTPLRRDITLSWFGQSTLEGATLRATLVAAGGTVIARATETMPTVPSGSVTRVATLNLATPRRETAVKATLRVEADTPSGLIANTWDYWLFPETSEKPATGDVTVVSSLDATTVAQLTAGGRYVLFGSTGLPAQTMSFQMGLAGRTEGNYATVVEWRPPMARFPHEGFCDWQFAKMMTGGTAVQFAGLREAFDPIIEVVSSYKAARPQAALFELRVGAGRLLVCTLKLAADDPAAAYLRAQLLAYAASEEFQPRKTISAEQLTKFMATAGSKPTRIKKTDEGLDTEGQLPKTKR